MVILAVVLVIALVVVYLVGGFSGLGASSLETTSKNYWAGASPFAITGVKLTGTVAEVILQNNDLEQLTITDISVNNGTSIFSTATTFSSGEAKAITGTLAVTCGAAGAPYQYSNVTITYSKGALSGLKETGQKALVGKCS